MTKGKPYIDIHPAESTIRVYEYGQCYENANDFIGIAKLSRVTDLVCHVHSMYGSTIGMRVLHLGMKQLREIGYRYILAERHGKLKVFDISSSTKEFDFIELINWSSK